MGNRKMFNVFLRWIHLISFSQNTHLTSLYNMENIEMEKMVIISRLLNMEYAHGKKGLNFGS